ncbi:MAG TPA: hypothetical protein VKH42_17035 [Vicinamibacterales bacterium]|nr:hypothetical protein [Vicinamibacterales bacterium]
MRHRLTRLTLSAACAIAALAIPATAAAHQKPAAPAKPKAAAPASKGAATDDKIDPRDANIRAYVELLRSDVRASKIAIMASVMNFTEAEDKAFWPIYRQYDAELNTINDERVRLIADYANHFESLTDDVADRIAKGALELENKRQELKVKYYDRVKSATSARTAARFLQVENQMLMIIDLQIAASLPIVQ